MKTENKILELTFDFALETINLYKLLIRHSEYVLSKQLLRSATSIGANVEEANAAQTKKEFIQRMSIASKEARETKYWLRLLDKSQIIKYDYAEYLKKIEHNVDRYSKTPIAGLVILGSTGEAVMLSDDEQRQVLRVSMPGIDNTYTAAQDPPLPG